MREIKFRAWDTVNNKWLGGIKHSHDFSLFSDGDGIAGVPYGWDGSEDPKDFEVMQYTGLKDKNFKEIYEGDIVNCNLGCPHEVIWTMIPNENLGGMPGFYLKGLLSGYSWTNTEELIGNIHENPELLKNV